MIANEYLLALEAHQRIHEDRARAAHATLVAAFRPRRSPLRIRAGRALVALGTLLLGGAAGSAPGVPAGVSPRRIG